MYPHSGFRSGGTSECTLVPVFVPGEHLNVPSSRFSFKGNIRPNHPFGKPPFSKTPEFGGNINWDFPLYAVSFTGPGNLQKALLKPTRQA